MTALAFRNDAEPHILTCGNPHNMDVPELFRANLAVVDRAIERVCRRSGLHGADADDFASDAKLALIENDYAILRQYRGESSLATFLTVIIQNLYYDRRVQMHGRWRPSAEAKRLGDAAVVLERLVLRDGRSLEEALPIAGIAREEATAMLAKLPQRPARARVVELEDDADVWPSAERADERVLTAEARRLSSQTSRVVRDTLARLPLEDRALVRFRFGSGMTIAAISRILRLPQRPLYRRIEAVLDRLRSALTDAGLDASAVADAVDVAAEEMDFGLSESKEAQS